MKWLVVSIVLVALVFIGMRQTLTFFVVQPIGALPDGVTLVIYRGERTNFIDSADGLCAREMGRVSLLCRAGAIGGIAKNNDVLLRLPYSEWLYEMSTDGARYER